METARLLCPSVAVTVLSNGDVSIDGANVIEFDILANNGLVQVIDVILEPPAHSGVHPESECAIAACQGRLRNVPGLTY